MFTMLIRATKNSEVTSKGKNRYIMSNIPGYVLAHFKKKWDILCSILTVKSYSLIILYERKDLHKVFKLAERWNPK